MRNERRLNMVKNQQRLILSFTILFLLVLIKAAMADAVWPAQSTWDTTFKRATIIIQNGIVTGTFDWNDGKFVDGKLINSGTIAGYWIDSKGNEGKYCFIISEDGKSFTGTWSKKNDPPHNWKETWNGTLVNSSDTITGLGTWPSQSVWLEVGLSNKITIKINNGDVIGSYEYKEGKMDGTLSADGKTISGHWKQTNNSGRYTLTISDDGQSFSGKICYGENDPLTTGWGWQATLVSSKP